MRKKLPKGKLDKLKKLIREKKFLEKQEELDRREIADSLKTEKQEAQETPIKSMDRGTGDLRPEAPANASPRALEGTREAMPESLEGYSLPEILLMEHDGLLNQQELAWVRKRSGRLLRNSKPLHPHGWMI